MSVEDLGLIREALAIRKTPIEVFFRDDDAGWDNPRLIALLDCFNNQRIPIDLAVIPQAADQALADTLQTRWHADPALLGLHQHGYAHCNHETQGRKCEFGQNRSEERQLSDLLLGKQHLEQLFGDALDPLFTPPWNRCAEVTANLLIKLNFRALSRNHTASSFNLKALPEIPVTIDWSGVLARSSNSWAALEQAISSKLSDDGCQRLGIMLHHAVMDIKELSYLQIMLGVFSAHGMVRNRLMRDFLELV